MRHLNTSMRFRELFECTSYTSPKSVSFIITNKDIINMLQVSIPHKEDSISVNSLSEHDESLLSVVIQFHGHHLIF
jgi:hypothetical protein